MDHREFENYLTLLSSLLQIRGEQREAIARELRAHLEDRLDDLLARGASRDDAVQQALAEFGDAAGLAANFSLLVRNRRRRWMVKVTSFSTAVLVLLAVGLLALWPEHRPGPAPARVIAQDPNAANPNVTDPNAPAGKPRGGSDSQPAAAVGGVEEKLGKKVSVEFIDTPLRDVLLYLADVAEIQIFTNRKAMTDEGLMDDTPITMNLKSVRLDLVLDLLLEQVGGLTYVERDGILIVSTVGNLEGASEVRVYNCKDLLAMEAPQTEKAGKAAPAVPGIPGPAPGGDGTPATPPAIPAGMGGGGHSFAAEAVHLTEAERRAASLQDLICTAVKPDSWSAVGGLGTISEYNGLIVINHTSKVHQKVEDVLKMLREAAGLEQGKTAQVHKK